VPVSQVQTAIASPFPAVPHTTRSFAHLAQPSPAQLQLTIRTRALVSSKSDSSSSRSPYPTRFARLPLLGPDHRLLPPIARSHAHLMRMVFHHCLVPPTTKPPLLGLFFLVEHIGSSDAHTIGRPFRRREISRLGHGSATAHRPSVSSQLAANRFRRHHLVALGPLPFALTFFPLFFSPFLFHQTKSIFLTGVSSPRFVCSRLAVTADVRYRPYPRPVPGLSSPNLTQVELQPTRRSSLLPLPSHAPVLLHRRVLALRLSIRTAAPANAPVDLRLPSTSIDPLPTAAATLRRGPQNHDLAPTRH
jgi:hypothetical protein